MKLGEFRVDNWTEGGVDGCSRTISGSPYLRGPATVSIDVACALSVAMRRCVMGCYALGLCHA
jgi:hypothetical protein